MGDTPLARPGNEVGTEEDWVVVGVAGLRISTSVAAGLGSGCGARAGSEGCGGAAAGGRWGGGRGAWCA